MNSTPLRVLFVGNDARYFYAHRIDLARALVECGYDVAAVLPPDNPELLTRIRASNIEVQIYPFVAAGMNPFVELRTMTALFRIYRRLRPDIAHHLTIKPILYGGIVARLTGVPARLNAVLGLGYFFNAKSTSIRLLRKLLWPAFRISVGGPKSIMTFENPDDLDVFKKLLGESSRQPQLRLLPGSGVEPSNYQPDAIPERPPIVVFAGRLLKTKGITEFVEAAKRIKQTRPSVRFVVCGGVYGGNPVAIDEATMKTWVKTGAIEWWGHVDNMPSVLARSSLVVLPSYFGEGVPRILIEAAAAARPLVSTDTPGCREIVREQLNGLLVRPQDPSALAAAIEALLDDPERCRRMGQEGRTIVETEFSLNIVIDKTLSIYDDLRS